MAQGWQIKVYKKLKIAKRKNVEMVRSNERILEILFHFMLKQSGITHDSAWYKCREGKDG